MAADGRLACRPCGDDAKHYLGLDPAAADTAGWAISARTGAARSSRRR